MTGLSHFIQGNVLVKMPNAAQTSQSGWTTSVIQGLISPKQHGGQPTGHEIKHSRILSSPAVGFVLAPDT